MLWHCELVRDIWVLVGVGLTLHVGGVVVCNEGDISLVQVAESIELAESQGRGNGLAMEYKTECSEEVAKFKESSDNAESRLSYEQR